ncbi:MAG: CHAD domain-containing protein, partial [Acidobacteriota bacterium]|nr:CHAD domain-containing protein [Acidobacteriota bacterium]
MERPSETLSRPPEEGARLLALACLDEAAAAYPRLARSDDAAALHDFRVALRRLRSCLRAYAGLLAGSLPGKLRRRLERLARATGPGRDTEVQIEWLRQAMPALSKHQRAGHAWLLSRLERRRKEEHGELTAGLARRFTALEADLRNRLSVYRAEIHLGEAPRPTFAFATAQVLAVQAADLASHLAEIEGAGDQEEAHRARISAKRLRYLLDPVAAEVPQ